MNAFDPVSDMTAFYGLRWFAGTVSVQNGSGVVTWQSGHQFSWIWHAPNRILINGTSYTLAAGTVPTGCTTGVAISCTSLTVTNTSWPGCTINCTYNYGLTSANSIYSSDMIFYAAASNAWTVGTGWGTYDDQCLGNAGLFAEPEMRQPVGMVAVDTLRNLLYIMGGVNQSCQQSGIVTNGTSTVTGQGINGNSFVQAGLWNGVTVVIPMGGTSYTIASVQSESSMTINCGGGFPACPSGATTMQVLPSNRLAADPNAIYDMWSLALTSTPAADAWTEVLTASGFPAAMVGALKEASLVYDPDDDGLILYGGLGTSKIFVFCNTAGNPGGLLKASQIAIGCGSPNTWATITTSSHPPAFDSTGLLYDTARHVVWQTGGFSGTAVQTDVWKYTPQAQAWTQMSSTNQPPAIAQTRYVPPIVLDTLLDSIILHYLDGPADYVYNTGTNNWSLITSAGASIPNCTNSGNGNCSAAGTGLMTVYDPSVNKIIGIPQGNPGTLSPWAPTTMWQASIQIPVPQIITGAFTASGKTVKQ
jgi:hypothetical protein